jgi:DNA replication and repair protein RecF
MVLNKLRLTNFRNYNREEIDFRAGTNILFGRNGQGKTNILESLYYLALTKSFRTNNDQNLILNKENYFRIEGEFRTEKGRKLSSSIAYSPSEGKRLNLNNQKIPKFVDYIGTIPLVLLAPSDLEISQGGPHQRRQFIDIMLSQAGHLYLHNLLKYRRVLKQRSLLLQQDLIDETVMAAWDQALIQHGSALIEKRLETIEELDRLVKQFYMKLSGGTDQVKLIYQTSFTLKNEMKLDEAFLAGLKKNAEKDRQAGTTSCGPHRDEILFLINGKPLRWMGSQGEHKTFIIALKMAEYDYLRSNQKNLPLLLFDDIFGELDESRIKNMIGSLNEIGQVFITTTSPHFFNKVEEWNNDTSFYEIRNGQVTESELS